MTLGAQDKSVFENGRVTVETSVKIVHSGYDENSLANDIAILVLAVPVVITSEYTCTHARSEVCTVQYKA